MPHTELTLAKQSRTFLSDLYRLSCYTHLFSNISLNVKVIIAWKVAIIVWRTIDMAFLFRKLISRFKFVYVFSERLIILRVISKRWGVVKSVLFYFLLVYAVFIPRTIKSEWDWVIQVISVSKLLWKQRIIDRPSYYRMMYLIESMTIFFCFHLCSRCQDSVIYFNFFIYIWRGGGFFMIFLLSPPCLLVTAIKHFCPLGFPLPIVLVEEKPLVHALLAHLCRVKLIFLVRD